MTYFLGCIDDFTINNIYLLVSQLWNESECIVTGGKQMSGILKSITARSLRSCLHQREYASYLH